jgi:multisubunit Na+/H+ antiporter MnhC subunit
MTVQPIRHRLSLIITAMVVGALLACALVMGIASLANASTMRVTNFRYTGKVLTNPSRTDMK